MDQEALSRLLGEQLPPEAQLQRAREMQRARAVPQTRGKAGGRETIWKWGMRFLTGLVSSTIILVIGVCFWCLGGYFTILGTGAVLGWFGATTGLPFTATWDAIDPWYRWIIPVMFSVSELLVASKKLFPGWKRPAITSFAVLVSLLFDMATTWFGLGLLQLPEFARFLVENLMVRGGVVVLLTVLPEIVIAFVAVSFVRLGQEMRERFSR